VCAYVCVHYYESRSSCILSHNVYAYVCDRVCLYITVKVGAHVYFYTTRTSVYVIACERLSVCVYVCVCVYITMRVGTHAYFYTTCTRVYVIVCMYVCVHFVCVHYSESGSSCILLHNAHVRVFDRVCAFACVCVCVRMCVSINVRVGAHV